MDKLSPVNRGFKLDAGDCFSRINYFSEEVTRFLALQIVAKVANKNETQTDSQCKSS
jgi:hypothetical protein